MADNKFVELAFDKYKRAIIVPVDKIPDAIAHANKVGRELFCSYFSYGADIEQFAKIKNSVSTFPGPFYLDKIQLDIDKGKDSDERVLMRARGAIMSLQEEWEIPDELIRPYYSGSGYHIEIPEIFGFGEMSMSDLLKVKKTLTKHFPFADDLYYGTSIIRVVGTINKKTKRYKIPLTIGEILNETDTSILERSVSHPTVVYQHNYTLQETEGQVLHSSKIVQSVAEDTISLPSNASITNIRRLEASKIVTCVQRMYNEGPKEGSRHNTIMRMVSTFRRNGVPREAIIGMMHQWGNGMEKDKVTKLAGEIFDKGFRYGCNDSLMSKHCDSNCIFFKKKNYGLETSSAADMMVSYKSYLEKLRTGCTVNLKDIYKMKEDFRMLPGEFVVVFGDSGVGKTAWVQNLVIDFDKAKTLYLSLEVHEALLFRRFLQIAHNLSKEQVDTAFETMSDPMLSHMVSKIEHIKVCTVPPTLQSIEKMIVEENPQIVVIDTLDGLDVEAKGETEKTLFIAHEMKRIANATNTIIIGIHHISKHAAIDEKGARKHLNLHSGKGSSSIEQKGDKVIGIEADSGNNTTLRHISSLKARDETPFIRMPFNYEFNTFRYRQINHQLEIKADGS